MRQLLINSLMSLATGICFMTGVFIVTQLFEKIDKSKELIYTEQPDGFKFKNHKIVPDQETFTIEGKLINTRDIKWNNVQLVVRIYVGDAYMTYCRMSLDHVGKRSIRAFTLVCRETAGSNLPENLTYELAVKRATK